MSEVDKPQFDEELIKRSELNLSTILPKFGVKQLNSDTCKPSLEELVI